MRRVIVRIESLVLKGFRPEERHAIVQGLQEQLARELSMPQAVSKLEEFDGTAQLRAGGFSFAADASPSKVGVDAGRRIGKGLGL